MKYILFIKNYRSGTNLWNFMSGKRTVNFYASLKTAELVGAKPLVNPEVEEESEDWWLPTIPPKICRCSLFPHRQPDPTQGELQAFHVNVGDWWGYARSRDVPGPYDVKTPASYSVEELSKLKGDWRVIYIMRDGRNQIESLRNIPGGIEQDRHKEDPQDYFEVLCKGFRNRARVALDAQEQLPWFRIFYFEHFIECPVTTMRNMLDHADLSADIGFLERAYDLTQEHKTVRQHSSFGSTSQVHKRWLNWTEQEVQTFKSIAGKELAELGYTDWSKQ